jgi:drug/metabolite transporter (DMT)-like permease
MKARALHVWIALSIVYVVWGSTYLAIKLAVRTLPPLLTAGTRFLLAAALLAAILAAVRRSLVVPSAQAVAAMGVGAVMLGAGVGMVHVAEQRIDSGVAAMIAGSVPLQIVLWRTLAGERVPRETLVASAVGLVGLALVVGVGGLTAGTSTAVGLLVMLFATACWSGGSFASTRLALPPDSFVATAWQMLGGGLALVVAGTIAGEWPEVTATALQPGPVAAWLYLATAGSVIGFTAYAWLLQNAPISQVVTHQYVNPLVAVALGALVLGERPGPATLVGAVLIVGAVVATVRRESRARTAHLEPAGAPVRGR